MAFFRILRGLLPLAVVGVAFLICDPLMRLGLARLAGGRLDRKHRIRIRCLRALAGMITKAFGLFGVVSIQDLPRIPGKGGALLVVNHQSLFDIPIILLAVRDNFVRFVTRERYAHRIPVISQVVKIYQYPTVQPGLGAEGKRRVRQALHEVAHLDDAPLAIFPEGSRTKDGEVGRFRTAGLRSLLRARPWEVHVVVVDGIWQIPTLWDLITIPRKMRARVELAGVLDWTDPEAETGAFIGQIRELMVGRLKTMRGRPT